MIYQCAKIKEIGEESKKSGDFFWFFIPKIGRMQNNTYFCNVLFDVTITKKNESGTDGRGNGVR